MLSSWRTPFNIFGFIHWQTLRAKLGLFRTLAIVIRRAPATRLSAASQRQIQLVKSTTADGNMYVFANHKRHVAFLLYSETQSLHGSATLVWRSLSNCVFVYLTRRVFPCKSLRDDFSTTYYVLILSRQTSTKVVRVSVGVICSAHKIEINCT